mgnify:CR=1 FL=1
MNEQSIFLVALEIADPNHRADYLNQACGDEPALRRQVDALFAAHERSGEFLKVPALQQMAVCASGNGDSAGETGAEHHPPQGEIDLSFLEPATAPDSIGRLRHYDIHEIIGRGGCGIVLKAFDEKLHRIVAIKVMAPELAATSPARKRFVREARATAAIRHENVVSIHAVEEQPLPFLVMEYIDGQTLQQKLDQQGPLDVREVLRIGQQIAAGLEAAHAKELIHRDIKPGNILLEDGTDRIKITDFGLARSADDASMTQSGVISGTPLYMSPEQAQAHDIDHRSDLFSLGSVLYVMCSGRPPFRAATSIAVLRRVVEEQPRPIQGIIPEVPQWLAAIIAKLHAKNPEERFTSAREVGDLLARCQSELQLHGNVESLREILPMLTQPEIAFQEPEENEIANVVASLAPAAGRRTAWPGNRRWATAAAMTLVLLSGLGMSEATGVTNVRATVIRLFSPEGTLVVEVDDPGVSVTIDGEEMVITGTGAKEIRLKPGQYKLLASKDGKLVRQELVTVTTNGRQVVRVSRESESQATPVAGVPTDPNRRAVEYLLSLPGADRADRQAVQINDGKRWFDVRKVIDLPIGPFQLTAFTGNQTLDDAGLENLRGCLHLRTLNLWNTRVTPTGMAVFKDCQKLQTLSLIGHNIDDAALEPFQGMPLKTLHVQGRMTDAGLAVFKDSTNIETLSLIGKHFTGTGLNHFKGCTNLTRLTLLDAGAVTDDTVEILSGFETLKTLTLKGTKMTEAGVKKLTAALPECKVEWDGEQK